VEQSLHKEFADIKMRRLRHPREQNRLFPSAGGKL
jgi:hypothetical protein